MDNAYDYSMERKLRDLNPELHKRFTDAVFGLQHVLSNYKLIFPEYTDHTELHSLNVIDFCNQLIGDQIDKMNADEIYCLLMGCYFHDTGMGISLKDYEEFSTQIAFGDFFDTHSRDDIPEAIRAFHNEYSGLFVQKYAQFFEIPSDEHLWAIIQIARGHRKTSLLDTQQYPPHYSVSGGNIVSLPYLAALIRLADEIDVAARRNTKLLYDLADIMDPIEIEEHKKLGAVKELLITEKDFTLLVSTDEAHVLEGVKKVAGKMQRTLEDCRETVAKRSPYVITQEKVLVSLLD